VFHTDFVCPIQGNFCTVSAGSYKLVWDNTYSSFFKKVPNDALHKLFHIVCTDLQKGGI
jgi:hypothetical protein